MKLSVKMLIRYRNILTRLCDAGTDRPSLERRAGQVQSLLQALDGLKLHISEALGGLGQLVFHNADICHTTSSEKLGDIGLGSLERKVANVASVRGLGREIERLSDGISTLAL
jgi:hypothetical protein